MNLKLLVVDSLGDEMILKNDQTGQKFNWPKSMLPKSVSLGEYVYFNILSSDKKDDIKTDQSKQLAKDILNEILNVD